MSTISPSVDFANDDRVQVALTLCEYYNQNEGIKTTLPKHISSAIKHLWSDKDIQRCFKRANEYYLNDTAQYYFNEIDKIRDSNFVPIDQDILQSKVSTTGLLD